MASVVVGGAEPSGDQLFWQVPPTQTCEPEQHAPQPQSEVPLGQSATQRPAEHVWPQPQPPGHPLLTQRPLVQV